MQEHAWRVYFQIDPLEGGYSSLGQMLWALRASDVMTTAHHDERTVGDFTIAFCLHGRGKLSPDSAAVLVDANREEFDSMR